MRALFPLIVGAALLMDVPTAGGLALMVVIMMSDIKSRGKKRSKVWSK